VGRIWANGGGTAPFGSWGSGIGGGSGGAVRLLAPWVHGSGMVSAEPIVSSAAGFGRIRVDCLNRTDWSFDFRGHVTYGRRMQVLPAVVPRLDFLMVVGRAIPEGIGSGVSVQLSSSASSDQSITIQARDFTNNVPIRVVLTPENGPSGWYDTNIVMSENPTSMVLPITIPPGGTSRIHVWSR